MNQKTNTNINQGEHLKNPMRKMHSAAARFVNYTKTSVTNLRPNIHISKRGLPDKGFKVFQPKNKIIGKDPKMGHYIYEGDVVTPKGEELPLHEQSHACVRDNQTGKDVGILTSQKKDNIKIADHNFKEENKAQYYRPYDTPRYSSDSSNMKEVPDATAFVQKYDKEINDAVKNSDKYKKPALFRVDKNSSHLYHENGTPIYDKNGKEIDYD